MRALMEDQEIKTCLDCRVPKPLMRFHRKRVGADGRTQYMSYCKDCQKIRFNASRAANIDWFRYRDRAVYNAQHRVASRRRKYGLDPEGYDLLLAAQDGKCAICAESFPRPQSACVDHDHVTGVVRGLLCDLCNRAIGYVKDDPIRALRIASYLTGDTRP